MNEENQGTETNKSNMTQIVIVLIVAVLGIGGWFMFSQNSSQSTQTPQTSESMDKQESSTIPTESNEATTGSTMTDASSAIAIEGGAFYFKPNEIRVKKGEKVTITFTNAEGFHDFVIDEFNVRTKQLSGGQSETIEFTPDKAGEFEFYCSVGEHRQKGMVGTLIVE